MPPCPDLSALEGLFQGTLSPPERTDLERHLDECERCAATVAELARLFGSATWAPAADPISEASDSELDTEPSTPNRPRPGDPAQTELGRYRLGRRLGAGGMGMVFEAEDRELHRQVAVKLLYPDRQADSARTQARLLSEARAMARLAHPNVVAVHDVGRVDEQVFLAMELVEGSTLSQWLQDKPRTRAAILEVFVMAGRGLEAAHGAGLVHRDFKPDNVLVGADGRARVTDFGLALAGRVIVGARTDEESSPAIDVRASTQILTERGAIVGTPAYMAPEQWRGLPAEARSDQFSFCVALYEALFGIRPFVGETLPSLMSAVLDGRRRALPRTIPRWLRVTLERGLSPEPAARFPSMHALLATLERDRSKPWRIAGSLAAVGLGAAGAVAVFARVSAGLPAEAAELDPIPIPSPSEPANPGRRCDAVAKAGRARWTPVRRDALAEHVGAMDHGEALATIHLPMLDRWIGEWTTHAEALCEAAPDAELADAERRCLDAALARFDAHVQLAGELPGFKVASALVVAAHQLPNSARCRAQAWLSLSPEPPPSDARAKATLLAKDLAALTASIDLEQWIDARDHATRVLAEAEDLAYAPLLGEAQLVRAQLELAAGDGDAAIPWFEAAIETAELAGDERVLGLAALALGEQLGAGALRHDDAERWLRVVATLADRLGDPALQGRTLLAKARVYAAIAEYREALTKLDEAEPLLREAFAEGHPLVIELELERAELALATADPERATQAAAHAEDLAVATLGPNALLSARAKATRAKLALARQDFDEAEVLATAASKITGTSRSRRHDYERGMALGLLGEIAAARGDDRGALEFYRRAEIFLYIAPESALPLIWQGALRLRLGEHQDGFASIDAGWATLDGGWADDDLRRVELLRLEGLAALEAGQFDRARVALERALTLVDEGLGFGPRQALAQLDLAELELATGHRPEALALLDDAYVGAVAGLGQHHPRITRATLARADLAWALGQRSYAERLYGVVINDLAKLCEPDDPELLRARARRSEK